MTVVIVLSVYAAYLLMDFRQDAKSKNPRIIWPCLILFCLGAVTQILYELKVSVPSPAGPITAFVSSLFSLK
jgi:hypothetical protein